MIYKTLYIALTHLKNHMGLSIRIMLAMLILFLTITFYFTYTFALNEEYKMLEDKYIHKNIFIASNLEDIGNIKDYADVIRFRRLNFNDVFNEIKDSMLEDYMMSKNLNVIVDNKVYLTQKTDIVSVEARHIEDQVFTKNERYYFEKFEHIDDLLLAGRTFHQRDEMIIHQKFLNDFGLSIDDVLDQYISIDAIYLDEVVRFISNMKVVGIIDSKYFDTSAHHTMLILPNTHRLFNMDDAYLFKIAPFKFSDNEKVMDEVKRLNPDLNMILDWQYFFEQILYRH